MCMFFFLSVAERRNRDVESQRAVRIYIYMWDNTHREKENKELKVEKGEENVRSDSACIMYLIE